MRKTVGKIIILFSVLIALTGSISIQARAEQETNLPVIEGTFYDSDQTTPILTVKSAPGATGMYVNEVLSNQALLTPVRNGYELDKWYYVEKGRYLRGPAIYSEQYFKSNFTMVAVWKNKPYEFGITYHLNNGVFTTGDIPYSFNVTSPKIKLPVPVKSGYIFGGWYRDRACTKKKTAIYPGSYIDSDKDGNVENLHLYAKWIKATPEVPGLTSVTNGDTGKVVVEYTAAAGAQKYEIRYSRDKTFKTNVHTITTKALSATITNLPKGKAYYFKVRACAVDSCGKTRYSAFSKTRYCKISDGVTEAEPASNSAKLKKVRVKNKTNLYVEVSVSKRLKSSDDFYYLVKLDPVTGKVEKMVGKTEKTTLVTFTLPLKDDKGKNLIQGKYALAVKKGTSYMKVSGSSFIKNPEDAAGYTAPFPTRKSKKGLQGYLDTALNAKHTFLNMNLRDVLGGDIPYEYNGKTYYFRDAFSGYISTANRLGMTVSGQVMISWIPGKTYMILPEGRSEGHSYYAMNAREKKAREELEAAFCFMAERYSRPECHLDNWILGNEVNIHQMWYYAGNISKEEFMKNYADTFRIMYYAVKSNSANARLYICCDHTWSDKSEYWGAKSFMNMFHTMIKKENADIQWNLAFHAYPANLLQSATWNDQGAENNEWCSYVTPKNLDVLTDYVSQNFGKKTRIILSEQGFTSTCGEDVQAAGLAYLFYKAEFNDMIDSCIFRSQTDNPVESAMGLRMGLSTEDGRHKEAYKVFQYMDTPTYAKYTNKYLNTIGISSWKQIAPDFDASGWK